MFDPSLAISLAILIAVALSARKNGQTNPVGTASIQTKLGQLERQVGEVEIKLVSIMREFSDAPSRADLALLSGEVKVVQAELRGVAGHAESIDAAVVRMEVMMNGLLPGVPGVAARRRK